MNGNKRLTNSKPTKSGTLPNISHRGNKYEKGTYRTIERLRRFLTAHDMIGTPASDEQVLCAEQELGVKFSSDYIDFIKNFGTAYAGMMINALDGNENVVEETKSLREVHPEVTDTYVISDDGSGNPIMINSKGEVEIYYHDSDAEIKTIAPSLEQYIEDNFPEW